MDTAEAQALVQRARNGDPAAQEGVADLLAQAGDGEQARTWLESAARAGRGSALSRLGLWDIAGFGAPADGSRGVERVLAGAKTGDSESMHVAAFVLAGGIGFLTPNDVKVLVAKADDEGKTTLELVSQ